MTNHEIARRVREITDPIGRGRCAVCGVIGCRQPHVRFRTEATCVECGRVFNLRDEHDVAEYAYGHDCEG